MRVVFVLTGVMVALLCLACGIWLFFLGRETVRGFHAISQIGEQFLTQLQRGDYGAAVQMVAPARRAAYSRAELQKRWDTLQKAIGRVQRWSVLEYNIYVDTAGSIGTLTMRVQGDKGSGTVDFVLKSEGDRWLITELRFGW